MNPPRLDEFIPKELLQNPVPMHSHWDSFAKLIRVSIAATLAGMVLFACAILSWSHKQPVELTALFALGGMFMLFLNVYAIFVAEDERQDKQWRRNMYAQQLTITQIAIQHLTIIQRAKQVNIGNGVTQIDPTSGVTAVNQSTVPSMFARPELLYPEVDTEVNSIYQVALVCIRLAYTAWQQNNNARPKIKPFSFDAVVKQYETGHVRWKTALEWCEEAQILKNALQSNWSPVCESESDAVDALDKLLVMRGYYRHSKGKESEWRRALPKT